MSATIRTRHAAMLPLLLVVVLMATLFAATPSAEARMSRGERIGKALDIARHQKGDPYRYGSSGPGAFDCSGLIYYATHKAGFKRVPRTSDSQASFMNRIKRRKNMRKGDMVFFYSGSASARNVYHVGVFVGKKNGHRMIVQAPYGDERVHRARIWTNDWFPGSLRGI